MKPVISVITPFYNRGNLLPRMIESVLAQSFNQWELILMDDGSIDNSRDIIKKYQDPRIRYFYTENSGASDKRNQGALKAQGKYIIFLDSDDEVKPLWLEKLLEPFCNTNTAIVCCGFERVDATGNLIGKELPGNMGVLFGNEKGKFLAGTIIFKKEIFLK